MAIDLHWWHDSPRYVLDEKLATTHSWIDQLPEGIRETPLTFTVHAVDT